MGITRDKSSHRNSLDIAIPRPKDVPPHTGEISRPALPSRETVKKQKENRYIDTEKRSDAKPNIFPENKNFLPGGHGIFFSMSCMKQSCGKQLQSCASESESLVDTENHYGKFPQRSQCGTVLNCLVDEAESEDTDEQATMRQEALLDVPQKNEIRQMRGLRRTARADTCMDGVSVNDVSLMESEIISCAIKENCMIGKKLGSHGSPLSSQMVLAEYIKEESSTPKIIPSEGQLVKLLMENSGGKHGTSRLRNLIESFVSKTKPLFSVEKMDSQCVRNMCIQELKACDDDRECDAVFECLEVNSNKGDTERSIRCTEHLSKGDKQEMALLKCAQKNNCLHTKVGTTANVLPISQDNEREVFLSMHHWSPAHNSFVDLSQMNQSNSLANSNSFMSLGNSAGSGSSSLGGSKEANLERTWSQSRKKTNELLGKIHKEMNALTQDMSLSEKQQKEDLLKLKASRKKEDADMQETTKELQDIASKALSPYKASIVKTDPLKSSINKNAPEMLNPISEKSAAPLDEHQKYGHVSLSSPRESFLEESSFESTSGLERLATQAKNFAASIQKQQAEISQEEKSNRKELELLQVTDRNNANADSQIKKLNRTTCTSCDSDPKSDLSAPSFGDRENSQPSSVLELFGPFDSKSLLSAEKADTEKAERDLGKAQESITKLDADIISQKTELKSEMGDKSASKDLDLIDENSVSGDTSTVASPSISLFQKNTFPVPSQVSPSNGITEAPGVKSLDTHDNINTNTTLKPISKLNGSLMESDANNPDPQKLTTSLMTKWAATFEDKLEKVRSDTGLPPLDQSHPVDFLSDPLKDSSVANPSSPDSTTSLLESSNSIKSEPNIPDAALKRLQDNFQEEMTLLKKDNQEMNHEASEDLEKSNDLQTKYDSEIESEKKKDGLVPESFIQESEGEGNDNASPEAFDHSKEEEKIKSMERKWQTAAQNLAQMSPESIESTEELKSMMEKHKEQEDVAESELSTLNKKLKKDLDVAHTDISEHKEAEQDSISSLLESSQQNKSTSQFHAENKNSENKGEDAAGKLLSQLENFLQDTEKAYSSEAIGAEPESPSVNLEPSGRVLLPEEKKIQVPII